MKTKVITLENVKVCYRIPRRKLLNELREGVELVAGAVCLFLAVGGLALVLYSFT